MTEPIDSAEVSAAERERHRELSRILEATKSPPEPGTVTLEDCAARIAAERERHQALARVLASAKSSSEPESISFSP